MYIQLIKMKLEGEKKIVQCEGARGFQRDVGAHYRRRRRGCMYCVCIYKFAQNDWGLLVVQ